MVAVGTVGYLVDVVFLLFYMSIVRRVKNNTLLTYSLIYQAGSFLRRVFISGQNPRLCTRKARERYEIQHAIEKLRQGHWIQHWMWSSFTDRKEALQLL